LSSVATNVRANVVSIATTSTLSDRSGVANVFQNARSNVVSSVARSSAVNESTIASNTRRAKKAVNIVDSAIADAISSFSQSKKKKGAVVNVELRAGSKRHHKTHKM
jgi:hypothetical protein